MQISGHLRKLRAELHDTVQYRLPLGEQEIALNALLGKTLRLSFAGEIQCIACGRVTNKSFSQGYCYPCCQRLARCDICIVRPEKCHYHQGTCREPEWGESNCLQPHYVYLANSSGLKVGITRVSNTPTRWIDQGASQALPLLEVNNRLLSGRIEVAFKQHVADKTDWRRMLKAEPQTQDLVAKGEELLAHCADALHTLGQEFGAEAISRLSQAEAVNLRYPVTHYPEKITSLNLDKTPEITGILQGIKGQYLILDCGVLNIRKFSGYKVDLELATEPPH